MLGGAIMITALVQFQLSSPVSLAEATQRFEATAPKYQKLPGLIRKYYIRSEDGRVVGGVYLWQTRQAAERVYSAEWRERVPRSARPSAWPMVQPRSRSSISTAARKRTRPSIFSFMVGRGAPIAPPTMPALPSHSCARAHILSFSTLPMSTRRPAAYFP